MGEEKERRRRHSWKTTCLAGLEEWVRSAYLQISSSTNNLDPLTLHSPPEPGLSLTEGVAWR